MWRVSIRSPESIQVESSSESFESWIAHLIYIYMCVCVCVWVCVCLFVCTMPNLRTVLLAIHPSITYLSSVLGLGELLWRDGHICWTVLPHISYSNCIFECVSPRYCGWDRYAFWPTGYWTLVIERSWLLPIHRPSLRVRIDTRAHARRKSNHRLSLIKPSSHLPYTIRRTFGRM